MRFKHLIILPLFLLFVACNQDEAGEFYRIQGFTQGTTYHITYQYPEERFLKTEVDSLLDVFDNSLSSYDSSSIISAINRNEPGVETDSMFRVVFRESERLWKLSDGAFDITLAPIINAWGFGPGERRQLDSIVIDSLLQYVGMEKTRLVGKQLVKDNPNISINVNAIAQGYSVDVVSKYLDDLGCNNYMVEIGGELRTKGVNSKGSFWRIGVDRPEYGNTIPGLQMQVIIRMHDRSLATSGNYRKYYEQDGVRITHSIDPLTGFPKTSRLLSATILSEECMTADALATACMVKGLDDAKVFIEGLKGVDAYFIFGDNNGNYQSWYTKGLKKYIQEP